MNNFFQKYLLILFAVASLLGSAIAHAQEQPKDVYVLSIQEAVLMAKDNNDHITAAKLNRYVSGSELKEVKSHALPHVVAQGFARRLTNVTLYESGGLSDAKSLPPPPASYQANLGVEAAFNLYSGGKHEASIKEHEVKTKIADVNILQQQGSISLQVVQHYLEILRMSQLDSLYKEQINREKLRLKNINSLYANGKVTRSDVLRAEINLSNQEFAKKENESDIDIYHNRLNVLLHLPEETKVVLSDTAVVKTLPAMEVMETPSETGAFSIQQASLSTELQLAKLKDAKSNYYPTIELTAAYNFNYPNYLIYPYIAHAYSIGFVGVRLQYSISSLYQNNHKVAAEKQRLQEIKVDESAAKDEVRLQITSLQIKMTDMRDKIALAQQNIEQSQVNYKIVSTKYFNQLALLTDLLEADNIYLQSKYKLIEAQTSLLNYYYQILYTTGKI